MTKKKKNYTTFYLKISTLCIRVFERVVYFIKNSVFLVVKNNNRILSKIVLKRVLLKLYNFIIFEKGTFVIFMLPFYFTCYLSCEKIIDNKFYLSC